MFDDRVRAREHQAGMAVVETHQVRRLPARPADLDDLARPLCLAHDVAPHAEPVSNGCLHRPTSSPAVARHPCPAGTLTASHRTTTSIYLASLAGTGHVRAHGQP